MTGHGGAQVTFVESYAQPRSSVDDGATPPALKLVQLRPSLMIAGDARALEVVRTVHSPKAALAPAAAVVAAAGSPLAVIKRRLSFSDSCCGAMEQCNDEVSAATPHSCDWQLVWRQKLFERASGSTDFFVSLVALLWTIQAYGAFLRWHENRRDIDRFAALPDPVLPLVRAQDLSTPLFVLFYGAIIGGCVYSFDKPDLLLEFSQTNTLMMWVHMVALYLTPLEAPQGMIPLVDLIAHADGTVFMRNLFFSGHAVTTCLVFLVCRRAHWRWKALFLTVALATAAIVIVQKMHYTTDVFVTPFFVATCHGVVQQLRRACGGLYTDADTNAVATLPTKLKAI